MSETDPSVAYAGGPIEAARLPVPATLEHTDGTWVLRWRTQSWTLEAQTQADAFKEATAKVDEIIDIWSLQHDRDEPRAHPQGRTQGQDHS